MNYHLYDEIMIRCPLLSTEYLSLIFKDSEINDKCLLDIFKENTAFQEAIFLASPEFYYQIEQWYKGKIITATAVEKLRNSLLKYVIRACTRPTPFGLFAGCFSGKFDIKTEVVFDDDIKYHRTTSLDILINERFYDKVVHNSDLRSGLKFYVNSSLYSLGDHYRYIRYEYRNTKKEYHLTGMDNSEFLEFVFNCSIEGILLSVLTEKLCEKFSVSREEADHFIHELVNKQLLVCGMQIELTGKNYIDVLSDYLKDITPESVFYNKIIEVRRLTRHINSRIGNSNLPYEKIFSKLSVAGIPFEKKYTIQSNLYFNCVSATIDRSLKKKLCKALKICNAFTLAKDQKELSRFKEDFVNRYRYEEIPLIEALDSDLGIGYGINRKVHSSFTDDIKTSLKENETEIFEWTNTDDIIFDMVFESTSKNRRIINLPENIITGIKPQWNDLPDSMSAFIELVNINGRKKIVFSGAGGSSAANLLSRFGDGNEKIKNFVQKITNDEEKMAHDYILAEIIHLPQARTGNILKHPAYRKYEIPYLGMSSLGIEKQIPVEDIMISVKDNKLSLRSKSMDKFILPRLTNAHNYKLDALPIYQFLCDLQYQSVRPFISFMLHPVIKKFPFLPRIEYNDVILSKARWLVKTVSIRHLIESTPDYFSDEVAQWVNQLKLPTYVQLVEGDNKLLIKTNNLTSLKVLISIVKKKKSFILEEFFQPQENIGSQSGNSYCNEMLISFYNRKKLQSG